MAASSSDAYFIIWNTNKTPSAGLDLPTLVKYVKEQKVTPDTWLFVTKTGAWERAADVQELGSFFQVKPTEQSKGLSNTGRIDASMLRGFRLFANFSEHQLLRFLQFAHIQKFPLSATIVKQGDRGDAMYVILEGELTVRLRVGDEETTLACLTAGDFFGDIALFDQGPRSADVVATAGSLLLKISAQAFDEMSREAPDLATPFLRALGKTLTARIRAGNKHHGESVMMSRAVQ
jgi:CRP/FNR family cyclic AMP-dependent transcriptional regulator